MADLERLNPPVVEQQLDVVQVPEPCQLPDLINNDCYQQRFCPYCVVNFKKAGDLDKHLFQQHPEYFLQVQQGAGTSEQTVNFSVDSEAINGKFVVYKADLANLGHFKSVDALFDNAAASATSILTAELEKRRNLLAIFAIYPIFSRTNPATGQVEYTQQDQSFVMRSFSHKILEASMIPKIWQTAMNKIAIEVEDFTQNGSGWVLDHIAEFAIKISTVKFIGGSSYMELPAELARKSKCLLNIRNDVVNSEQDHLKCFVWSVLAHEAIAGIPLGPAYRNCRERAGKNPDTYKRYLHKLNLTGLCFPMTLEQIPRFEKQNPDIGITVIGYDMEGSQPGEEEEEMDEMVLRRRYNEHYAKNQKEIRKRSYPLYVSSENRPIKVDLMLLIADTMDCEERPDHFVLIQNLVGLLRNDRGRKTKAICRNCLNCFNEDRTYNEHQLYCPALRLQKTRFPLPGENICSFNRWDRTQPVPFIITADFESFVPDAEDDGEGKTVRMQEHIPCGYSWICVDYEGNRHSFNRYHKRIDEENISERFLNEIIEECTELQKIIAGYQEEASETMLIEENQNPNCSEGTSCCFCGGGFPSGKVFQSQRPVRHHLHLPPYKFIGYAHNECNLRASLSTTIPVIFHNFSSYDSHFIVQALNKEIVKQVEIIPRNSERFLSITINSNIKFIDSYAFFNQSLAKLAASLPKDDPDSFRITRQMFGPHLNPTDEQILAAIQQCGNVDDGYAVFQKMMKMRPVYPAQCGNIELLMQKLAYPYSYMKSAKQFQEVSLPPPEAFYNDLTDSEIEPEVYERVKLVCEKFDVRNLGDLHDLYVAADSALLADIFQYNRKIMFKHYQLDIAHYLSLPMVAKDALLKKTEAKLELLTDPTMYCWLEKGIRGGLVCVGSLRAAEANNPYMGDNYNPEKPTSYITFLDANNQYGWALSQQLPLKDFVWVEGKQLTQIQRFPVQFIQELAVESPTGYILEVDLEIPEHLHDYFNDYPPAPVRRSVDPEVLSTYQRNLLEKTTDANLKTERLIADLLPKRNMVCHYRNLQMWLQLGCTITMVHKVLRFTQSAWMKPYIDFNTDMRKLASSDIEIAFWKALNNCGFGKMIERLRDRQNIIPILTEERALRYTKKPTIQDIRIINENLVFLMMHRLSVSLYNPIAVGFACLELSKLITFGFHYGYMKPKYGNMARLLYSDTDSLAYWVQYPIKDGDIYRDFKQDEAAWFDMSVYDPNDPVFGGLYSPLNKKVLGKMSDELANSIITHMIIPKPKMYIVRSMKNGVGSLSGSRIHEISFKKKAKGVGKSVVEKQIFQDDYERALEGLENEDIVMKTIRSFNHVLYTVHATKKNVSGCDVKRFCLDDCVNTLAHGHKDIPLYRS